MVNKGRPATLAHANSRSISVIRFGQESAVLLLLMAVFATISPSQAFAQNGNPNCIQSEDDNAATNRLADVPRGQLKGLVASYYLDPAGTMGPDDAAAKDFTFIPCQTAFEVPSSGGALWLRFTASNPHEDEQDWGIAFMETIVDEVTLYEQGDSGLSEISRDGRIVPVSQNTNSSLKTAVFFAIESDQEKTYYARVSGTYAPSVTPVISSASLLSDWSDMFTLISASLLVFSVIMILFSLLLFRHIDIRFYQYYAAYLFGMFCLTSLYDGWFLQVMGITISINQIKPFIELSSGLVMLANIQYCRVLLTVDPDPRERRQGIFHVLTGIGVVAVVWAVWDPWGAGTPLPIVFILCPFVMLYVSGRKALSGMRQAVPVFASLLALSLGLFSSLYFFLFPVDVVPTSSAFDIIMMRPITLSYATSTMVEGIFMMIAISSMINAIQHQRNTAVSETVRLRGEMAVAGQRREKVNGDVGSLADMQTIDQASGLQNKPTPPIETGFLNRATEAVIQNINQRGFGASALASALGVTEKTLGRRLKKSQGLAPAAFIRSIRLSYARDLILLRQFDTVAEIANASGFSSLSHFAKLYRQEFRTTPSEALKSLEAAG